MSGLLSAEHIGTVAAIVVIVTALLVTARLRRGGWTVTAARILAIVLAGDEIAWWIYLVATHENKADLLYALPFQLCDAAIIISAIALWTRQQLLIEVTYFWGLAGTFQALITPDIPSHFPSFTYIQYYVAHGGVVAAALFLVVGLGHWPRPRAVLWVFGVTIAYAAFVGLLDALTGADYLYLSASRAWWLSCCSSSWTRRSSFCAAQERRLKLVPRARFDWRHLDFQSPSQMHLSYWSSQASFDMQRPGEWMGNVGSGRL